jgi:hypothetical protein
MKQRLTVFFTFCSVKVQIMIGEERNTVENFVGIGRWA